MNPLLVVAIGFAGGFLLAAGLHQAVGSFRALLEQAADDDALDELDDPGLPTVRVFLNGEEITAGCTIRSTADRRAS